MTESLLICTPMYGGFCHRAYFESCMNLKEELLRTGLPHDWSTGSNESLVHRARMEMTAKFLQTDFTHMLWIDGDIEFEPEDVAKLWNMNTDIAVGIYCMKKKDEQWFAAWKDGVLVKDLDQFEGPTEVDVAGTGFMLIRRAALEKIVSYLRGIEERAEALFEAIASALSDDERTLLRRLCDGAKADYVGAQGKTPALYMTPIHNGGLESEDYHFCRIAQEAGFKVMMEPSVRLKHWGQFAYGA